MLQSLINFFKPYKQEPVQIKVEDTVKVEAPAPEPVTEVKVPVPEVKAATAPKAPAKGRPKGSKPAAIKAPAKPPRKKK